MAYANTKVKPCNCPAYSFPHRLDSDKCKELYNSGSDETYREFKEVMAHEFYRTEAKAINAQLRENK